MSVGCGNHGCCLNPPTGVGTNGGCRCLAVGDTIDRELRTFLRSELAELRELRKENAQLRRMHQNLEQGPWHWTGTDEDDLDSMGSRMLIAIEAQDLRNLLILSPHRGAKLSAQEADRIAALLLSREVDHAREAWGLDELAGRLRDYGMKQARRKKRR